ncbi:WD repeat-containing protein 74 [Epargyreus clarus]|uniref:WD repeat-containing protein 74 n=1 Tax=Epargyreus clarus TaxID=520877 RepID=UPI003C303A70
MLLPQDKEIDIFVASRIGSFKHIKYYTDTTKNSKKCIENLVEIKSLQKDDTITSMVWGNPEQTEILLGKKNQQIQVYDTINGFTHTYTADFAPGHVVGLGRHKRRLVAAVASGVVKVWSKKTETVVKVGGSIDRMRVYGDLFATGGEENDLKVWRMGEPEPLFAAKNLAHDWLQLRRPVWVSDLCFLGENLLAVCSRHGYVRLYDTRAQRRPVCNVDTASMAATCISPSDDERQVYVGFGRGQLHQVDLREGRLSKGYKGAVGAVSDVTAAGEWLLSASLDRHVRLHRRESKELVYKQYLTSKLSCVLVQTATNTPLRHPPETDVKEEAEELEPEPEDLDDIFEGLETVGDKPRKHKEEPITQEAKRQKLTTTDNSIEEEDEDAIKQLLKKTEKQKRRIEKKKKEKKAKSVFHTA